jgi:hypothetical protein
VEAKLAKDVHACGEAVEVTIVVHQEAHPHAKKKTKIAIKKIKAEITQSIDGQKAGMADSRSGCASVYGQGHF